MCQTVWYIIDTKKGGQRKMAELSRTNKLKSVMVEHGYNQKDFEEFLDISPVTLRKKIRNPDTFTIGEVNSLSDKSGIPKDKLLEIIA